jgi:hypothetical protein
MAEQLPQRRQIVVDGSNIATEGRTLPSLAQLDEAIRAFLEEYRGFTTSDVIVVVDASFGHRIDPSEVAAFDQAVEHGEMVTPPAGAVGRGDGFILRIAEKSGALVLSNDSFQEFHAERPWLFEPGRLIGGKPIPGVGWIFTPRTPVRGVKSRAVTAKSKRVERAAEAQNGQQPEALEPSAVADGPRSRTRRRGRGGSSGAQMELATESAGETDAQPAAEPVKATKATKTIKATKAAKATKTTKTTKTTKATKATAATKAPKAAKTTKATKTSKATKAVKTTKRADSGDGADEAAPTKVASSKKTSKATTKKGTLKATKAINKMPEPAGTTSKGRSPRAAKAALATEPISPESPTSASPPEALNDPLTFLTFVADHPVGSTFDGTVVSFTSHGAHIDVGGMLCHVPLRGMASPPPKKARQVVTKGETRPFVLVSLDAARRRAELAVPGVQ